MCDEVEEVVVVENVLERRDVVELGLTFFLKFLGVLVMRNEVENEVVWEIGFLRI